MVEVMVVGSVRRTKTLLDKIDKISACARNLVKKLQLRRGDRSNSRGNSLTCRGSRYVIFTDHGVTAYTQGTRVEGRSTSKMRLRTS